MREQDSSLHKMCIQLCLEKRKEAMSPLKLQVTSHHDNVYQQLHHTAPEMASLDSTTGRKFG